MPILTTAARCLIEVANAGSIRRAAENMNLSASAVNRQILNLEDELGVRLLKRLPRGVALTSSGRLVLDRLLNFNDEIDRLHQDLCTNTTLHQTTVTIGIMDCLVGNVFTDFICQITKHFPEVTLRVEVAFMASDLLMRLEAGEIDLVVAFDPPEQYGFWAIHIVQVPIGTVVSPKHSFAIKTSITLSECYTEQIFLPDRSMLLGRLVQSILPQRLQVLPLRTNSLRLIRNFVMQGNGITFMNIIDVWNDLKSGDLKFIPFTDHNIKTKLAFCVRDRHSNGKEVQDIAYQMKNMIEEEVFSLISY